MSDEQMLKRKGTLTNGFGLKMDFDNFDEGCIRRRVGFEEGSCNEKIEDGYTIDYLRKQNENSFQTQIILFLGNGGI